jgi:hypothetical protein
MQRHSLQSYQIKHAYQIIRLTSLGVSQDTALHPSHSTACRGEKPARISESSASVGWLWRTLRIHSGLPILTHAMLTYC